MSNEYALMHVLAAAKDGLGGDAGKVGVLLTNAVKIKLSHPGTGRVYRSRNKNVGGKRTYVPAAESPGHLHQASAPGEPPAVDTGAYRASWMWDVETLPNMVVLAIGTPDEIGPWLEFGTRYMLARPHIRPVVNEYQGAIGPVLAAGIVQREQDEARRRGGRG